MRHVAMIPSGNYANMHWAFTKYTLYTHVEVDFRNVKYFMLVDGIGKHISSSFMGVLREGAVLKGWVLWYSRKQRLAVHFKRWRGGNMLSGWHFKCREFACLCAALPQDAERQTRLRFSHQRSPWNKMVFSEKCFSTGNVIAVFYLCFLSIVPILS